MAEGVASKREFAEFKFNCGQCGNACTIICNVRGPRKVYCNLCIQNRSRDGYYKRLAANRERAKTLATVRADKMNAGKRKESERAAAVSSGRQCTQGKYCCHCYGLPWTRPDHGVCVGCKEPWQAEDLGRVSGHITSSAGWALINGDFAREG